jgi:REP element-mobilizing transposase RayT
MRKSALFIGTVTRAVHLIITGYGHWLPNDPRGSGSSSVRAPKLRYYGPVHFGRKRQQPLRAELRAFHRNAEAKLEHPVLWFDEKMRDAIARGIERAQDEAQYTIWACAILRNHVHLVIRTHRDKSMDMLARIAGHAHESIHAQKLAPEGHPVWSNRPYKVYLRSDTQIQQVIRYVGQNPMKEGLAPQKWGFVVRFEK